ncbi:hypothetical protein [Alsobacter sp. R-9]
MTTAAASTCNSPFVTVDAAAQALCASRATVYALAQRGVLRLAKLHGRTVVDRGTLMAAIAAAAPYSPSTKTRKANEARAANSRRALHRAGSGAMIDPV